MPSLLPGGIDTLLSYKPYGVFLNGNFWVCLFLLISAYLPARQIMRTPEDKLRSRVGTMILKRYPRLMLPAFSVCVINFILLHVLNALHMNYINKPLDYSFGGLLMHGLVLMWTKVDSMLIGPFWTLHYFLLVPLFAMLLAIPACKENRYMPFIYSALLIVFFEYDILFDYYMAGVLGVLLADLTCHDRFAALRERIPALTKKACLLPLSLLLLLAGLWMGGYPSYVDPEGLYTHFCFAAHCRRFPDPVRAAPVAGSLPPGSAFHQTVSVSGTHLLPGLYAAHALDRVSGLFRDGPSERRYRKRRIRCAPRIPAAFGPCPLVFYAFPPHHREMV